MKIEDWKQRHGVLRPSRRRVVQSLAWGMAFAAMSRALAQDGTEGEEGGPPPPDALTPTLDYYATLSSYADTGTVETFYQWPDTPELNEHHRFETAFRAPRNFFFRFDSDALSGNDALVVWCDGGDFQSWWKATGVHDVWDGGRGANAFLVAMSPTKESANLIAPMLFPKAELYGPVVRLLELQETGEEPVDGVACRKFVAAGRTTGVSTVDERPVSLWVDRETGLFRRIVRETGSEGPAKSIDTITYGIAPEANPELPDERFMFVPPT